jgi:hypothetical protein
LKLEVTTTIGFRTGVSARSPLSCRQLLHHIQESYSPQFSTLSSLHSQPRSSPMPYRYCSLVSRWLDRDVSLARRLQACRL